MPIVPVPGLIKMQILSTQENTQRVFTAYYQRSITTPPSVGDLNSYASQFWTAVNTLWTNVHAGNWNDDKVLCTDYGEVGGAQGSYVIPQPHPGAQSGTAMPANVAIVTSLLSGFTSRSKRGRIYHGGFLEADAVGSTALSGLIGRVNTAMAPVFTFGNLLSPTLTYSIYSPLGGFSTQVSAYATNNILDSQRRRLPGRGR